MEDYSPDSGTREQQIERTEIKNKELDFELTETDIATLGKVAAAHLKEISDLEAGFQSLKDDWKARISSKEADLRDALKAIQLGKQRRRVDCVMVKNFTEGKVSYVFEGREIESRAMDAEERQQDLPGTNVILRKADQGNDDTDEASKFTTEQADQAKNQIADAFRG